MTMRLMNLDDDEQNVWMIIKVMKMSHSETYVKNTGRDENNQDLTITLLLLLPLPIQGFAILVRLVSPLHLLHLRALVLKPDLVVVRYYIDDHHWGLSPAPPSQTNQCLWPEPPAP